MSVPSMLYNFMAAGGPIVGLARPDSEVFALIGETGCGVCAPPDDPAAIAGAFRRLAGDAAARSEMASRGRAYAEAVVSRRAVLEADDRWLFPAAEPAEGRDA